MPRVIVPLTEDEYEALLLVSEAEKRDPRDQVALWARRQLENGGLLAPIIAPATMNGVGQEPTPQRTMEV